MTSALQGNPIGYHHSKFGKGVTPYLLTDSVKRKFTEYEINNQTRVGRWLL